MVRVLNKFIVVIGINLKVKKSLVSFMNHPYTSRHLEQTANISGAGLYILEAITFQFKLYNIQQKVDFQSTLANNSQITRRYRFQQKLLYIYNVCVYFGVTTLVEKGNKQYHINILKSSIEPLCRDRLIVYKKPDAFCFIFSWGSFSLFLCLPQQRA